MSMDTTITIDHVPADQAEADRIAGWFELLAERFELWEPDVSVWVSDDRTPGRVYLASYGHKYEIDRLDTLARIVSRLIPGCDVRVEEEGLHDDYWAETATYRSGRMVRTGRKEWVEHNITEP
jgi:hypothetical protein